MQTYQTQQAGTESVPVIKTLVQKKKAEHRSSSAEQQRALAIATNNQFPAANQDKPPNEVSRASPTTIIEAHIYLLKKKKPKTPHNENNRVDQQLNQNKLTGTKRW